MWIELIGSIILLAGVVLVYDGRRMVRKYLNFGEENLAVQGIKMFGFVLAVIGCLMMF